MRRKHQVALLACGLVVLLVATGIAVDGGKRELSADVPLVRGSSPVAEAPARLSVAYRKVSGGSGARVTEIVSGRRWYFHLPKRLSKLKEEARKSLRAEDGWRGQNGWGGASDVEYRRPHGSEYWRVDLLPGRYTADRDGTMEQANAGWSTVIITEPHVPDTWLRRAFRSLGQRLGFSH